MITLSMEYPYSIYEVSTELPAIQRRLGCSVVIGSVPEQEYCSKPLEINFQGFILIVKSDFNRFFTIQMPFSVNVGFHGYY